MIGALGVLQQRFGHLARIGDTRVITLIGPLTVIAGDDLTLRLTVTDDADARVDLTTADALELEVKRALGGADPAAIAKSLGAGITLLDQTSADTRGQADIVLTAADTGLAAGLYWLDVVLELGGGRAHVIAPREFVVTATVNLP